VTTASLDPFRGYATALSNSLPGVVRVLDAFHVVRLGQAAVDDVRRRRQQETLGGSGHHDDPLYRDVGCCGAASPRSTSGSGPSSN
jgi:transposase